MVHIPDRQKRASDYLNDSIAQRRRASRQEYNHDTRSEYQGHTPDPKGWLLLTFGQLPPVRIAGGPYRNVPPGSIGVNMAEEIQHPHTISVPTRDFSTPDMEVFSKGVTEAGVAAVLGYPVYVGCMGGIGRTGLFLAGLTKVSMYMEQLWWERLIGRTAASRDVIAHVRSEYYSHALETKEQEAFVDQFDPRPAAKVIRAAQKIPRRN